MFNSPSSGYVLTPAESARIYDEIPAVCATKEGAFRPASSRLLHELAPDLTIWECDLTVYRAGWLRAGIVVSRATRHGRLPLRNPAAADLLRVLGPGLERQADRGDGLRARSPGWTSSASTWARGSPAIPGGRTTSRTGAARSSTRPRCSACRSATIPHSRPPQAELPEAAKTQIDAAYRRFGLVGSS